MKRYRQSYLMWIGSAVAILGAAPLLISIVASSLGLTDDPNPNPVMFGMLFFLTFWPGAGVAALGVYRVIRQNQAQSETQLQRD